MLKGIKNYFSHADFHPFQASLSVRETNYSLHNTFNNQFSDQVQQTFPQTEIKSTQTDSVSKPKIQSELPVRSIDPRDTSATLIYPEKLPFELPRTVRDEQYFNNFMLGIPGKNISGHYNFTFKDTSKAVTDTIRKDIKTVTQVPSEPTGLLGAKRNVSIDWIPGFLLLSLFVFSWIKILYQKYIVQVVSSSVNYQTSIRLLRERNVLFQNMALGLNFVFAINAGLFLHYFLQYFNLSLPFGQVESVLILSFAVILLTNIKTFTCRILANIFSIKEDFAEYIHNINLFNKNIGLFLFPVVVSFPYIARNLQPFLLYLGLIIVSGFFILGITRGVQIIMRKGSSVFYLILYLCAIEILPVLLLLKLSGTLI